VDRLHVHQLLHGYKNGHELLAGSVKLPQKDAELVARLSDLSGTLQSGIHLYPYLSVYPLPSGNYYAIARTWLDNDAPRSGCVLTHTLLVRMENWTDGSIGIDDMVDNLRMPARSEAAQYRGPITIEPRSVQLLPSADAAPSELEEFVGKYFSEGIRPIVWFRDNDPSKLLIAVMLRLWPALCAKFAACTLSLQPRSLLGGPFDLLFAPTSVYSRFSKIPRENLIDGGKSVRLQRNEPWVSALASTLATPHPLPLPPDWPDFKQALTGDPTSIRWLYLLNDLRARTAESSMAALGVMDVIETLCPDPATKTDLKAAAAAAAIKSADQISDPSQTFSHLQLICERLSHAPYAEIGQHVLSELSARVARAAAIDVGQALSGYETLQLRSRNDSAPLRAFEAGLTRALMTVSADAPDSLRVLHAHEVAARAIIPSNIQLAERYLRLGSGASMSEQT
jgi:GTPase-associated protein 1, N-terminal domain type 1